MTSRLVSILTPFKNPASFFEPCLQSILNQTYSNWELLLVDDHSTDNSFKLASKYAKSDPRIRVFKNPGQGIIPALRMAFDMSKGDYVTRMDSDDLMYDNKLELLVRNLDTHGLGHVAIGQVKYFSESGISDGYEKYERWLNRLTEKGTNYSEIYKECVIPSPCWMVSREDLIESGAFDPDMYPEDYDLTFRFYKAGLKCIPCGTVIHKWRDYPERTSRNHEHYAMNYFLDIKLYYFLQLHYDPDRTLTIWGAGFKGKTVAKYLLDKKVSFIWICDNPNKIGKKIYGETLLAFEALNEISRPQCIITVANEDAQAEIRAYLHNYGYHNIEDYFFFC